MSDSTNLQAQEFGSKNVTPLFWKYSLLALAGLLLQTCSVIADGLFVGNGIGEIGLATIGIVTSMWVITLSFIGLFGVGGGTIIANKLGSGDIEGARTAYGTTIIFTFIFSTILAIIVLINLEAFLTFLGATPDILPHAKDYAIPYFLGFPFCVTGGASYYYVRASGRPKAAAIAYMVPAIIAIILEYLMIYKWGAGMEGASIPWITCVGLAFLLVPYMQIVSKELRIKKSDFKINFNIIKSVFKIGFAAFLLQICTIVSTVIINRQIINYGGSETEIAAFGTINAYIGYVVLLLATALVSGMQPIASYNLGMKDYNRVRDLLKKSYVQSFIALNILVVLIFTFSKFIVSFFTGNDPVLAETTISVMKVFLPLYAFGAMSMFASGYFQAVEKNGLAILSGISKIIIFAAPLLFIIPSIMGLDGIWFAQPTADFLAFTLTGIFLIRESKKLKNMADAPTLSA